MKASEVKVGKFYTCTVSGSITVVKVERIDGNRIEATNTRTGRTLNLRSARRLQEEVPDPALPKTRYRVNLTVDKDGKRLAVTRHIVTISPQKADTEIRKYYDFYHKTMGKIVSVDKIEPDPARFASKCVGLVTSTTSLTIRREPMSRLTAKVAAVNKAHKYANELYALLAPIFRPLIGQVIDKQDGTMLAKFKKLLPELPNDRGLRIYRHSSKYSLAWCVSANESDGEHGTIYHEVVVYVGDFEGAALKRIYDAPNLRHDYTAEEVEANRKDYKAKQDIADEAKGKLHPFGEYDR